MKSLSYQNLTDAEKLNILKTEYEKEGNSFLIIAEKYDTYPNKIRRDANRLGIKIKDKSLAQKNALAKGTIKHPTKGKSRTDQDKEKIGIGVMQSWDELDDAQIRERKNRARENWNSLSDDEKANILYMANLAVRQASKTGSKLEKFILNALIKDGYKTEFHREQSLSNTKLQIDIFLPELNIAIEVDGPSHHEPIWGEDSLNRNIKSDQKKTGLILGKGLVLIRIKQTKDYSPTRAKSLYDELRSIIKDIINQFPEPDNRIYLIGG